MRRSEGIVNALGALGETGQASALPQCAYPAPPARQNLVRIGLMSDIPDELVRRGVKDIMKRHREFHHTQPGAKMSPCYRDGIDSLPAQLISKLTQFAARKRAECGRLNDSIEQWRFG